MKFSIPRKSLLKPLQLIAGVVERRQTLPILSNVLLKASQEGLSIIVTDLEIEMSVRTSLDCPEEGKVTLPSHKLIDICRALPEQAMIEISTEEFRVPYALVRTATPVGHGFSQRTHQT